MNCAGTLFVSFSPAISDEAAKTIREVVRGLKLHRRNDLALGISPHGLVRPLLAGLTIAGVSSFGASRCAAHGRFVDRTMGAAEIQKILRAHKRAWGWLRRVKSRQPDLVAHWLTRSAVGAIGDGCREAHVRFSEGVGCDSPAPLDYLEAYDSVAEARASIGRYLDFFNRRRPHSSLDGRTPDEAYFDSSSFQEAA